MTHDVPALKSKGEKKMMMKEKMMMKKKKKKENLLSTRARATSWLALKKKHRKGLRWNEDKKYKEEGKRLE